MLSPNTTMDFSAATTPPGASRSMKISDSVGSKSVLAARGIGKTVKSGDSDLVILRDIDLEIISGEAVAIVGASGSGKSTLLAILAGPHTPPPGALQIEGSHLFSLHQDQPPEPRGPPVGFAF